MAILEIMTLPNPLLRTPARKVRSLSREVKQLIEDMIETMRAAPGVGLAATQVGVSHRVIVVEYEEPSQDPQAPAKPPKSYCLINPEIVRKSKETETAVEACLSVPGYAGEVERHTLVTVKGLNRRGTPIKIKASGWLARIFQHEIDHLDGVLFIDRASKVWKVEVEQEREPAEGI